MKMLILWASMEEAGTPSSGADWKSAWKARPENPGSVPESKTPPQKLPPGVYYT